MPEYVIEPDGTITFDPGPDDYARIAECERELEHSSDDD
jgi:hypothetical protein